MPPNQKLAEQYGTSDIAKNREIVSQISKEASDLHWGMGLLGAGLALAMMQREGRRRLETEVAHRQLEEAERERVFPATGSLRHTRAPVIISSAMSSMVPVGMDEGMVRIASAIGADLAGISKEAAPFPTMGIGAAAGGFKNMLSGAAKGMFNGVKNPAVGALGKVRQGFQEMGAHMTDVGNKAMGIKAPAGQSQLAQMRSMHANQNLVASAGTARPPTMKAPGLQPAQTAAPKTSIQAAPEVINPAKGVNGQAPTAPAAGAGGPGLLQRTGLFNDQGKLRTGRLMGAGALLGAGYLGYKGLQKGIDFMNEHPAPANYNLGGAQLPMGVNQYGNPQF